MVVLLSGLSNAAGVGGGPLNTLNLKLFFKFTTFKSISMTQVIIFGGSFMSILLKIPAKHPTKPRPLIDYGLVSYLTAPLLAGTSIGVILHLIIPDYLSSFLLVILLLFMGFQSVQKGVDLFKKESVIKRSTLSIKTIESGKKYDSMLDESEMEEETESSGPYQTKNLRIKRSIMIIAFVYFTVMIGSFVKGGKNFDSIIGVDQCVPTHWLLIAVYFTLLIGIAFLCSLNLIHINNRREAENFDFDDCDPR